MAIAPDARLGLTGAARGVRRSAMTSTQLPDGCPAQARDVLVAVRRPASEGHTSRSTWSIVITNAVPAVLEQALQLWRSSFGIDGR